MFGTTRPLRPRRVVGSLASGGDPVAALRRIGCVYALEIGPLGPEAFARQPRRDWPVLMAIPRADAIDHVRMIAAIATRADRDAFAALFSHFAPRVKGYMLRLGAAPQLAEDLAQETMLTVWSKAAAFDEARAAPSTWIFTIARNLRIDVARRERSAAGVDLADAADPEPAPDARVGALQSAARVRTALVSLPPEQAEAIRLSFFLEKPHAAIAEELGLPLGTVKSRLRLAMRRLRDLLGELA